MAEEASFVVTKEEVVLEKFEGDAAPENLVERVFLEDGTIVKHEFIEDGEVVKSIDLQGGELDATS